MNRLLYIAVLFVVIGCGANKDLLETQMVQPENAPVWIQTRPVSSFDYIGIGRARITGASENYQALAKRNALNDLASEIEIRVSSNSLLHTLEEDERFSETYQQSINTTTDLHLEGFEAYDSYSGTNDYYVYYRLNKQTYAEMKATQKREAVNRALDQLKGAESQRERGGIRAAARQYIESIEGLKEYWGEENPAYLDSVGEVMVDSYALERLLDMLSSYDLYTANNNITLNADNQFHEWVNIVSQVDGRDTEPVLMRYSYADNDGGQEERTSLRYSLEAGHGRHTVFSVKADPFKELRGELGEIGMRFLEESLSPQIQLIEVHTEYPPVVISSQLRDVSGGLGSSNQINSAVANYLSGNSMEVDGTGQADYSIKVLVESRDAGMSQGFHVVMSDVIIEARDKRSNTLKHSLRFNDVKGVHKTLLEAQKKSLVKVKGLIQEMDNELIINML